MALNRSKKEKFTNSFVEYVFNQKELSYNTVYGNKSFGIVSEKSKQAGKGNNPFLNQDSFTTMKEGTEIVDTAFLGVFQRVGDCNEKTKW